MVDLSILMPVGAGLVRSLVGWVKGSLADGEISEFEWRQLGETIVRVGFLGVVIAYFPGLDLSMFEASVAAIGGDIVLQAVKQINKKK